jgi:hypothetical protein
MKTKCVSARKNNSIPTPFLRATPITLYFSDIQACHQSFTYSPTDALVSCLRKQFFGSLLPNSATYTHQ